MPFPDPFLSLRAFEAFFLSAFARANGCELRHAVIGA
jgi:hypothetical protein